MTTTVTGFTGGVGAHGGDFRGRYGVGVLRTYVGWFRFVAIAEAVSWAGLLVAMMFKYGLGEPLGVTIFGWVHGAVFTGYVITSLLVSSPLRWRFPVLVLALAASVPPFGSVAFERWALKRGWLEMPEEPGPNLWNRVTWTLRELN